MKFNIKKLKVAYADYKYDLERMYYWIYENIDDDTSSGDEYVYSLMNDLIEGSGFGHTRDFNGKLIDYYDIKKMFER